MPSNRRDEVDEQNIRLLESAVAAMGEGRYDAAVTMIAIAQAGETIRIRRELQTLNTTLELLAGLFRNRL